MEMVYFYYLVLDPCSEFTQVFTYLYLLFGLCIRVFHIVFLLVMPMFSFIYKYYLVKRFSTYFSE